MVHGLVVHCGEMHGDEVLSWFLTDDERDNPRTRVDAQHAGDQAWSTGNLVRPLVHGATYFRELFERIEGTREDGTAQALLDT